MEEELKQKLKKYISNFNTKLKHSNDAEVDSKIITYYSRLIERLAQENKTEVIIDFINTFLEYDYEFYIKYGDELFEKIWLLYDIKEINIENTYNLTQELEKSLENSVRKSDLIQSLLIQFFQFNKKTVQNFLGESIFTIVEEEGEVDGGLKKKIFKLKLVDDKSKLLELNEKIVKESK